MSSVHDDADLSASDAARLAEGARELLRANDTGRFIKPSRDQYPHQWNWDVAFIVLGLRHADPGRAWREVRSLLQGQWADGMLPHIHYPDGASDYFPGPDFWMTGTGGERPDFGTSGLTQPPLLSTAVRRLHEVDPDGSEAHLAEVVPRLLAWHRWLHRARDPDGTGALAIVHPWEAGTDNAPRFGPALEALGTPSPPPYRRGDQAHVAGDERPLAEDYDRFMHLIGLYRSWGWDPARLHAEAPFLVEDVLFNAVAHRAELDLRELAAHLGEDTGELDGWLAARRDAFSTRFWDDAAGLYLGWDRRSGASLQENDFTTFAPLFAGLAEPAQARRLVASQLEDPRAYAPDEASSFMVPTVAKRSPHFEPRRYWCGPVWLNANWLVQRGLEAYGFAQAAARLRRHSLELVRRAGFHEYYDPRDGSPCGSRGFSWSAALTLDLLAEAPPAAAG